MCREAIDISCEDNIVIDLVKDERNSVKEGLKNKKADLKNGPKNDSGSSLTTFCNTFNKQSTNIARWLIVLYFFNVVFDRLLIWFSKSYSMGGHKSTDNDNAIPFPAMAVYILLPSALAVGFNFKVHNFSVFLCLDLLIHDARGIYNIIRLFVKIGHQPSEHMVKEVALLGCAALLMVQSQMAQRKKKQRDADDSFAGLMRGIEKKSAGNFVSFALLIGRVALAALFFYIGYLQIKFIALQGSIFEMPVYTADGHNNNWVLVQVALAVPLMFGFYTRRTCLLLALALMMEACTCWPFWFNEWGPAGQSAAEFGRPLWWYTMHARRHFVANAAMAGGMLLLRDFGPGRFTLDAILKRD